MHVLKTKKTKMRAGLLLLALFAVGLAQPAAAGGTTELPFIALGTTMAEPTDPGTCVAVSPGVVECDNERSADLFGLPFWLADWETAGTVVTDFNTSCTDHLGRSLLSVSGTDTGTISAGGFELYVERSYSGCAEGSTGGFSIGTLTFTGGTGPFAGASGSAWFVIVTDTAPQGTMLAVGTLTI